MNQSKQNKFLNDLFNKSTDLPIISIDKNRYTNNLLGLSFEIPKGWNIVSTEDFTAGFNKQIFDSEFEEIKYELIEFFESPILVLTKLDINDNEFNGIVSPTINFSVDLKLGEYSDISLFDYANRLDIPGDQCLLKNFKIVNKGEIFKKEEFQLIKFDSEYLFEHEELEKSVMVELSVLNVDHNDFFLDFSMTQCKHQNQSADEEFSLFIDSLKLNI